MHILVTGGAGYIGSHTCVTLIEKGHTVVIADNLSNSREEVIGRIEAITGTRPAFHKADVTDAEAVEKIFEDNTFDGIIHFAGLKAVGESVALPLAYYYNNLVSTIRLAQACIRHGVPRFVFSSSATVYGDSRPPLTEDMPLLPATNPYGETKAMCERILTDAAKASPGLGISLLRYFNPAGAHESGLIGERPSGRPNNLMPFIAQVARGTREKLSVFGNDYDTSDGTGIRDYIHVMDLAEGHVAALDHLTEGVQVYNLGTGRGTSVLELIEAFREETGIDVPYEIAPRRPGDIAVCYADPSKAERKLKWQARRDIRDMCRDAWRFENNPED